MEGEDDDDHVNADDDGDDDDDEYIGDLGNSRWPPHHLKWPHSANSRGPMTFLSFGILNCM